MSCLFEKLDKFKTFWWPSCAPSYIPTSFSMYKHKKNIIFSTAALLRLCTGAGSLCYFSSLFLFIFTDGLHQPLAVVLTVPFHNSGVVVPSPCLSSVSSSPRRRLDGNHLTLQFRQPCLCSLLFHHFYFDLQRVITANISFFLNDWWTINVGSRTGPYRPDWYGLSDRHIYIKTSLRQFSIILICTLLFLHYSALF